MPHQRASTAHMTCSYCSRSLACIRLLHRLHLFGDGYSQRHARTRLPNVCFGRQIAHVVDTHTYLVSQLTPTEWRCPAIPLIVHTSPHQAQEGGTLDTRAIHGAVPRLPAMPSLPRDIRNLSVSIPACRLPFHHRTTCTYEEHVLCRARTSLA